MSNSATILQTIDEDFVTVNLRSDGIVHVHFKKDTLITVELQDRLEDIYRFLIDKKHPFVFTGGEFVTITAEARRNAKEMEDRVLIGSSAVVVKNLAQRLIADYYYRFNKPKNPYKVFKKIEDAIEWSVRIAKELRA